MENKNQEETLWTPEWEARNQYVQKTYDNARAIGIDVLKLFLQVVIALNIIPILFHDKISSLFENQIGLIHISWICILISVLLCFLAYFFIFEGYFHYAHLEAKRWLSKPSKEKDKEMERYDKQSNRLFNYGHYLAITAIISFIIGISCIIYAIGNL